MTISGGNGSRSVRNKQKRTSSFITKLKETALPPICRWLAPRTPLPPHDDFSSGQLLLSARRILVIRQDHRLGNMLLITPFLKELRRLAPQGRIETLVDSRFAEITDAAPWIDGQIIQHRKRMIYRPWEHGQHLVSLRRGNWDISFDLSNPDSFSSHGALVMAAAGARVRAGFFHPRSIGALNAPVALPSADCHYSLAPLFLLAAFGVSPGFPMMGFSPTLGSTARSNRKDSILINPGGRGSKRWPPEHFLAVIKQLLEQKQVAADQLVLIGGPAEVDLLEALAHDAGGLRTRSLSTLPDLVATLKTGRLYIGCDAGPLHMAVAAGVPTLSLFLTSNPIRYAPLGENHETILLGSGSRRWLETGQFTSSTDDPADSQYLRWPAGFAEKLTRNRPVIIQPEPSSGPEAEIFLVTERIKRAIQTTGISL